MCSLKNKFDMILVVTVIAAIAYALCLGLLHYIAPEGVILPALTLLLIFLWVSKYLINHIRARKGAVYRIGRISNANYRLLVLLILSALAIVLGIIVPQRDGTTWAGINHYIFIGISLFPLNYLIYNNNLISITDRKIVINFTLKVRIPLQSIDNVRIHDAGLSINYGNGSNFTLTEALTQEDQKKLYNVLIDKGIQVCFE